MPPRTKINTVDDVARSRIDSHEKVCVERYGEIKDSFSRVHSRVDWIMYTAILTLLASVGSLFMKMSGG